MSIIICHKFEQIGTADAALALGGSLVRMSMRIWMLGKSIVKAIFPDSSRQQ